MLPTSIRVRRLTAFRTFRASSVLSTMGRKRSRVVASESVPNLGQIVAEESLQNELTVQRRVSARLAAKVLKTITLAPSGSPDTEEEGSALTDFEDETEVKPKKRRRAVKNADPVVYDIPPVDLRTTSYRGRLGYACLNTVLRAAKPDVTFCSRTCRIATIEKEGLDFAKNLGIQNARDLSKLIEWNEANNIRFMRISSEMFPFASHAKYGYSLDYAAAELKAAGDLAKSLGHRMTLHPGQFTQMASPHEKVVEASVRELEYHTSLLRHMGMGKDSVFIIHMGGVYGDKPATLARFKENYTSKLSDDIKARLVLENDEMCYNADDLLHICEELNIPIVLDYHHNWIYPSVIPLPELLTRINAIWHRKGIKPKQHLSSPRPGAETLMERRAHAGRCKTLPAELELEGAGWYWGPGPEKKKEWVDLMIEAKDKEQAVLQLYRTYELQAVIWENLRPEKADAVKPEPEGGSAVKGRRTRKKAAKETQEDIDVDLAATLPPPGEEIAVEVEALTSPAKAKRKPRATKVSRAAAEASLAEARKGSHVDEKVEQTTNNAIANIQRSIEADRRRGKLSKGKRNAS